MKPYRIATAVIAFLLSLTVALPAHAVESFAEQCRMPGARDQLIRVNFHPYDYRNRKYRLRISHVNIHCPATIGRCAPIARVDVTVLTDTTRGVTSLGTAQARSPMTSGGREGKWTLPESSHAKAPRMRHILAIVTLVKRGHPRDTCTTAHYSQDVLYIPSAPTFTKP